MKKARHPVYHFLVALLIAVLVLGIALFIIGIQLGPDYLSRPPMISV